MIRKELIFYSISVILSFLLVLISLGFLFTANDLTFSEFQDALPNLIGQLASTPIFWVIISLPYLLIRLIRFWIRGYRKGGFPKVGKRLVYSFVAPIILIFFLTRLSEWYVVSEDFNYVKDESAFNASGKSRGYHKVDQKIRGMHVFGLRGLDSLEYQELIKGNIEHIVLVPYAYQQDYDDPNLETSNVEWMMRRDSLYSAVVEQAQQYDIEIIIKPHVWITSPSGGKWRADIWMDSDEEWEQWEQRYETFILEYAKMSEKLNLPLFCIGNEFYLSTSKRPHFWRSLIKKVRDVYSGELVYGANWDREFKEVSFWNELDYIGIQSYFPVSDENYPALEAVKEGWGTHLRTIKDLSDETGKKVMFTELGYKSTPDAAKYPWGWENYFKNFFQRVSNKTQVNCYRAFFDEVWTADWFSGAMIWQWQTSGEGNELDHGFATKGKPAFNELARGFKLDQALN